MYFAAHVPTVIVERRMNLQAVTVARRQGLEPLRWSAIFARGFATVAERMPELRRVYLPLPWAHLYEYPHSVAMIAVEREVAGEPAVFGCWIKHPAGRSIREISQALDHVATAPIEGIKDFRRTMRVAALPMLLRRFVMWLVLSSGRQRANYFGTFAISSVAFLGADLKTPRSVWTTLLSYGVLDDTGCLVVRIAFDHRAVDGATIARALARLEEVLVGEVVQELSAHAR
jgi:hypothetical protein